MNAAHKNSKKRTFSRSPSSGNRSLRLEALETRRLLSVVSWEGLLDTVGSQPEGALTGKIVYTSGGHGLTADNTGSGSWTTQRGELYEMIEDMGNQDQLSMYVDACFRAGATVVPMRPVGHQTNEVVLDNDDLGVSFVGEWSNSIESVFYGSAGDIPYRYIPTSTAQTAYARYRPDIPEAGFYPVYAWARPGTNRVSNQLYVIHHSGGATEVTINHKAVGGGFVYLGTYHFEEGTSGYVDISNRSSESGFVIADAIRFGNGMGDIDRGGGVSGYSREDEAGLYWIMAQSGQGVSSSTYRDFTSDRSSTIRSPILWASHMNQEGEGDATDRVYLGFHSNASGGSARGAMGLYNSGGSNTPTPHQSQWARFVTEAFDDTMAAIGSPPLEHSWVQRSNLLYGNSYGEIDNRVIGGEFDATIIEVAFHDNQLDAELLRDPKFREWTAQACVQGTVDYFAAYDTVNSQADVPDPVSGVRAVAGTDGSITISWDEPTLSGAIGDLPTGYRVYASTNGYGFNGGTYVAGRTNTSLTIQNVDADGQAVYFRVAAVNSGGESTPSETVAARPTSSGSTRLLIVNGFDRLDRGLNVRSAAVTGTVDRVRPLFSNSYNYCVPLAEAMEPYSDEFIIDTVSNEAIIAGDIVLGDYDSVFWILGEESSADATFDSVEQTRVTQYLNNGGTLFVSGAEIGWDLDHLNNGRTFYQNTLHAAYASDDAGTYAFTGRSGSIFEGISASFDDGDIYYDTEYPDVLTPQGGAVAALSYSGGIGGTAGIQYADGNTRLVMLGFPFETITAAPVQAQMMDAVLSFFGTIPADILVADTGGTTAVTEGGPPDVYRLELERTPTGPVQITIAGGTQLELSTTYGGPFSDRLELTVEDSLPHYVYVRAADDAIHEGPHEASIYHVITVSADKGYAVGMSDAVVTVSITDDDAAPDGDLNGDGVVSSDDLDLVRANWGRTDVPPGDGSRGDATGDGKVDSADLDIIRANWGMQTTAASAVDSAVAPAPVPAPVAAPVPAPVAAPVAAPEEASGLSRSFSTADARRLAEMTWAAELESRRATDSDREEAGPRSAAVDLLFRHGAF